MDFIEATRLLAEGRSVRRKSWDDKHLHMYYDKIINNGKLVDIQCFVSWMYKGKVRTMVQDYDNLYNLSAAIGENAKVAILATDWEEYFELHTFEEAIAALKEGKDIKRKMWTTKVIKRDFCDDQSISFTIDDFEANDWIIIGG